MLRVLYWILLGHIPTIVCETVFSWINTVDDEVQYSAEYITGAEYSVVSRSVTHLYVSDREGMKTTSMETVGTGVLDKE